MSEVNTLIDTESAVNQPTNDVVPTAVPAAPGASSTELRKALRELRHGHASDGASARVYPVPEGREALPLASARAREHICSFQPLTAAQNTSMRKYARSLTEQEVTLTDGTTCVLKLKPSTYEEMLALGSYTEVLKSASRPLFSECLLDYEIAPAGLTAATRQRARQLLESLGATHILAWAKDQALPVYQDLAQEIVAAWDDPKIAGLTCCTDDIPLKPQVKQVQPFVQGLAERAAHWPEALRPLLADLIKVLTHCVASKLHDYLVILQPLLQLSSSDLHAALLKLAQKLPPFCSFLALVHPVEWEQSGRNLHKFLQATTIKLKKPAPRKRSSKRPPKAQTSAEVVAPEVETESSCALPLTAEPTMSAAAPSTEAVMDAIASDAPEDIMAEAAVAEVSAPVDEISSVAAPASAADSAEPASEAIIETDVAAPAAEDSSSEASEVAAEVSASEAIIETNVAAPTVEDSSSKAPKVAAVEVADPSDNYVDVPAPIAADSAVAAAYEAEVPAPAAEASAVAVPESDAHAEEQAADGDALAEPPSAEVEVAEVDGAGTPAQSCKAKINALADKVCTLIEKVAVATEDSANGLSPEENAALRQAALASIQTQAYAELDHISQEAEQAEQRAREQYQKHLKRQQHKRERQLRKQARRHRK